MQPGAPPPPPATPAKKLRSIHWKVIPKSRLDNTIWAQKNSPSQRETKLEGDELEELEGLFMEQEKPGTPKRKKAQVVTLIDKQKSQGIEIVLKGLKMPAEEIVSAIAAMDEEKVSSDQLYSLLQLWPAQRDAEILQGYEGERGMLAIADRFLLQLLALPRVEQRLHCFLFKCQLRPQMEDVDANVALLQKACTEVKDSKELARVLTLALKMGNVLNQGKRTGGAEGIALSSLAKFKDTKSADNKTNLLRHLAAVLVRKHGAAWIHQFGETMPSLGAAAYISMTDIAADVREMAKGLNVCTALLKNTAAEAAGAAAIETEFVSKLTGFQSVSSEALVVLNTKIGSASSQFGDLCLWLGEDEKSSSPGAIFLTICGFSNLLVQAHEENEVRDRQETLWKKMLEAKLKASVVKAAKAAKEAVALAKSKRWHVVLTEPMENEPGGDEGGGRWLLKLWAPPGPGGASKSNSQTWNPSSSPGGRSTLEPEPEPTHGPTLLQRSRSDLMNEIRGKDVADHRLRKVSAAPVESPRPDVPRDHAVTTPPVSPRRMVVLRSPMEQVESPRQMVELSPSGERNSSSKTSRSLKERMALAARDSDVVPLPREHSPKPRHMSPPPPADRRLSLLAKRSSPNRGGSVGAGAAGGSGGSGRVGGGALPPSMGNTPLRERMMDHLMNDLQMEMDEPQTSGATTAAAAGGVGGTDPHVDRPLSLLGAKRSSLKERMARSLAGAGAGAGADAGDAVVDPADEVFEW